MKNFLKASALLAAMAASASVSAADVKLGVTGRIVPPACTVTLGSGGAVDYGRMLTGQMEMDTPTALTAKSVSTQIRCASNARFALQLVDNAAASKNDSVADTAHPSERNADRLFGMGKDAEGNSIGGYYLRFAHAAQGNGSTQLNSTVYNGTTWAGTRTVTPGTDRVGWRPDGATAGSAPVALSEVTVDLHIHPALAAMSELDMTTELNFQGDASLVLHYL